MDEPMTARLQFVEGRSKVHGYSAPPDLVEGVRLLELAAARDHAEAFFELALLHFDGRHYQKDPVRGTVLLEKAVALGCIMAPSMLGAMYAKGMFGASTLTTARDWLMKQAASGDGEYECYLGLLSEHLGAFAEAAKWYRQAITHKNEDAMCRLADLLLEGRGVAQNIPQALDLLDLASSEYESAEAYYLLGVLHEEGKFVEQDRAAAGGEFYLAAENGHVLAQMRYGESAEAGYGDPGAPFDAYVWTRVALDHLPAELKPRAEATLARIAATMTPETLSEADAEAEESRFTNVQPLSPAVSREHV